MLTVALHKRFDYVQLPNGVRLVPRGLIGDKTALLNTDGRQVISSSVMEIIWNDEYVAGRQLLPPYSEADKLGSAYFIYKVGTPEAEFFYKKSSEPGRYSARLKEVGLSYTVELSPRSSMLVEKTFYDLVREPQYRRRWYE